MTAFNALFLVAVIFLIVKSFSGGRRVAWLSKSSIPLALGAFILGSGILWAAAGTRLSANPPHYATLGVIEAVFAIATAFYVGVALKQSID